MRELVEESLDAEYLQIKSGLGALKESDRSKIHCTNSRNITGSVDIDSNLRSMYQNENRWDYAIGYVGSDDIEKIWFVEVHPAETSEIERLIKKAEWLKKWGLTRAIALWKKRKGLYWVASGRVNIRQHDKSRKRLALCGIGRPVEHLTVE